MSDNLNEIMDALNSPNDVEVSVVTLGIPPEKISVPAGTTVGDLKAKLGTSVKFVIQDANGTREASNDTPITAAVTFYKASAKENGSN